jgi:hypothetical protein
VLWSGCRLCFDVRMQKKLTFRGHSPDSWSDKRADSRPGERIFVLSPANLGGVRAQRLRGSQPASELGMRLRTGGVTLGELFSFASSLYFRGKLAYARRFAVPPAGVEACYVITSSRGLLSANCLVDIALLEELASVTLVDAEDERYRIPLQRDALSLRERLGASCEVALLGSVATPKYVKPLLEIFGARLVFPGMFGGRGNMSRGGLLLRCVREGTELQYLSAASLLLPGIR